MKIIKIVVDRAEGPSALCFKTEHATIAEANKRLRDISMTAPRSGGYDKTDVTVFFDGTDINGDDGWNFRFDVKYITQPDNDTDIIKHVQDWINFLMQRTEHAKKYWSAPWALKDAPEALRQGAEMDKIWKEATA
jgi:hypothetical protein